MFQFSASRKNCPCKMLTSMRVTIDGEIKTRDGVDDCKDFFTHFAIYCSLDLF